MSDVIGRWPRRFFTLGLSLGMDFRIQRLTALPVFSGFFRSSIVRRAMVPAHIPPWTTISSFAFVALGSDERYFISFANGKRNWSVSLTDSFDAVAT